MEKKKITYQSSNKISKGYSLPFLGRPSINECECLSFLSGLPLPCTLGDLGDFGTLGDLGDFGIIGDLGDFGTLGELGDLGDLGEFGDFEDLGEIRNEETDK